MHQERNQDKQTGMQAMSRRVFRNVLRSPDRREEMGPKGNLPRGDRTVR